MLHIINNLQDEFLRLLKDDPVRPEIPAEQRVNSNSQIFVLKNDANEPLAVTCVKFLADIPESVTDLADTVVNTNTAVFYTIWSYAPGAGRTLIFDAVRHIKENKPEIQRYVTLSPKTEMAKRFHLRNGAVVFRENEDTVNYEYHRVIL